MAKRTPPMPEEKIARYLAEGRGTRDGANYHPWLDQHDLNSLGNENRLKDRTTGRLIFTFSDLERQCLLHYDYLPYVVEIKEQYPLDRNKTRLIAKQLGIKHPADVKHKNDIVMTTDLVMSVVIGGHKQIWPRNCKYQSDLEIFNNIEHAEIERRYWEMLGWKLEFFTEKSLTRPYKENLETLSRYRFYHEEKHPYQHNICDLGASFIRMLLDDKTTQPLTEFCKPFEANYALPTGKGLDLALYLISSRAIYTDIKTPNISTHLTTDIAEHTRKRISLDSSQNLKRRA